MPKDLNYSQQRAQEITLLTRECFSISPPSVRIFFAPSSRPRSPDALCLCLRSAAVFQYLQSEVPRFAGKAPANWTCAELANVTARDINMYLEYLSLYYKDAAEEPSLNAELGKMRKLQIVAAQFLSLFVQKRAN